MWQIHHKAQRKLEDGGPFCLQSLGCVCVVLLSMGRVPFPSGTEDLISGRLRQRGAGAGRGLPAAGRRRRSRSPWRGLHRRPEAPTVPQGAADVSADRSKARQGGCYGDANRHPGSNPQEGRWKFDAERPAKGCHGGASPSVTSACTSGGRGERHFRRRPEAAASSGIQSAASRSRAMGLLAGLARGLARGADRTAAWTSKRGPRSFFRSRGAKLLGGLTSSRKFQLVPEQVPRLVGPDLRGCRLRPYVSPRAPPDAGGAPPLDARALFLQAAAPALERALRRGASAPDALHESGFRPQQEGRLFRLFPSNLVR